MSPKEALELVEAALAIRRHAYAPYSKLAVGAAILGLDGIIYAGVNVENASYGLTICAERAAVSAAVSAGCRTFVAVAVMADFPRPVSPCGSCRQVLAEFAPHAPVIMANLAGAIEVRRIDELLPLAFDLSSAFAPRV